MADNRMWLVYRPTGNAVFLGKRMAEGWYGVPDDLAHRIQALFDHAGQTEHSRDDMMLVMETCDAVTPFVNTGFRYKTFGRVPFTVLELTEAK